MTVEMADFAATMMGAMSDEAPHTDATGAQPGDQGAPAPDLPPVMRPDSDLEFEKPASRYLGLFGTVGALVGLAIGLQGGNAAVGMAVGLFIGVAIGMGLNTYTGR